MSMPDVDWTNPKVPDPTPVGHRETTGLALNKSFAPSGAASDADREAILRNLYAQLHGLNQERRAGTLTEHGRASLADIKAEIDRWELAERLARGPSEVVTRLEALTEKVLRLAGSGPKL
jgi:hypothetical protein